MTAGPYETFLQARLPRWLRGTDADRLTSVIGGMVDTDNTGAVEAVYAGLVALCPADAVEYHARDRLLTRLPGETDEALRERAIDAWTFWADLHAAANFQDFMRLVAGTDQLYVFDQANDNWQAGGTGYSDDDTNSDNASRHAIVVQAPNPWARDVVGPGLVVGPQLIVGIDMTADELSRIRAAYRFYRPANMVGTDIYVSFDNTRDAFDTLSDHQDPTDMIRIPLHRQMVGYRHHGMTVGSAMYVGVQFS